MDNIRVFIPVDKIDDNVKERLPLALQSYMDAANTLKVDKIELETDFRVVCPESVGNEIKDFIRQCGFTDENVIVNNSGKSDFCSQVNFAVDSYDGKWFSVLEYDDIYSKKWFMNFSKYLVGREDVSVFLPVNKVYNIENEEIWQYGNESVLASSFSNQLGYIDTECLESYTAFNLTGGIINTKDFKDVGCLKPSVKVAFTYELLLRLTKKKYKVFVVPKEGYTHVYGVSDSLTERYAKTMTNEDISKWYELAKRESKFKEDRNKDIKKSKSTNK